MGSKSIKHRFDRKDKSSTEFLRQQLKEELQDISKMIDKSGSETPGALSSKPANQGTAGKNSKSYYYEEDDDDNEQGTDNNASYNIVLKGELSSVEPNPSNNFLQSAEKKVDIKRQADERNSSEIKKTKAIADRMREELEKMKKEGLSEWTDIINQISSAPEGEDENLIKKAMGFFNILQKQIEFNKRILRENLEVEKQIQSNSQSDMVKINE